MLFEGREQVVIIVGLFGFLNPFKSTTSLQLFHSLSVQQTVDLFFRRRQR